jgi:cytochrome b involved in lipid metabolism
MHKLGGALFVVVGQLAIFTGILYYNDDYSANESPLGIVHIIAFFALFTVCELIYQIYQCRRPARFILPEKTMTSDEFNKLVHEQKTSLVILDDLVLDVSDYMSNHPGGTFLLKNNVGRDISKFFYGGYSQDGNLIANGAALMVHRHSNLSRLQVNTIAIARLIPNKNQITQDNSSGTPLFTASVSSRWQINKMT